MRWLIVLAMLLAQCCQAAAPAFAQVAPGRPLRFPADFGAHPEFKTEWWYVTGWLDTAGARPLGFQVTFFRSRTGHDTANPSAFAPKQLIIGHAALSDPALGKLVHDQRSAREGFGLAYARTGTTDLKLDDWRMRRGDDGVYTVSIRSKHLTLELRLAPGGPVWRRASAATRAKGPGESASYYYNAAAESDGLAGRGGALRRRDRQRLARPRVVEREARSGCKRLGLGRRQPRRRLGADGFPDSQQTRW
jgi:predicted secreted hydrolase